MHLGPIQENEFLERIAQLNSPTRADIHPILHLAFEIDENNKITKLEKLDLLINRWQHGKMNTRTFLDRIKYLDLRDLYQSETLETFIKALENDWRYGEEWDLIKEQLQEDFKVENKYSEFLIKDNK